MVYVVNVLTGKNGGWAVIALITADPQEAFDTAFDVEVGRHGYSFVKGGWVNILEIENDKVYPEFAHSASTPTNPVVYRAIYDGHDWKTWTYASTEKYQLRASEKVMP